MPDDQGMGKKAAATVEPKVLPPRSDALVVLAANIRSHLKHYKMSPEALAAKAKEQSGDDITGKTVRRILKLGNEPRLINVESIAKVFGLEAWQLLIPLIPGEKPTATRSVVVESAEA
jgi:hypothetical protein